MTGKEIKPRASHSWQEYHCTHSTILSTILRAGVLVCLFEIHFCILITLNLFLI